MIKHSLIVAALLATGGLAQAKSLTIIDFEGLPGAYAPGAENQIRALAPHYKGLNWSEDFYVLNPESRGHSTNGYGYGAWDSWVGYTAWANPVSFYANEGQTFDFYGGYFAAAWDSSLQLTVKGYRDGVELYSSVLTLTNDPADLPKLYSLNFRNVDAVSFASSSEHVVFDNLQISAVPEPETYALLAAGLAMTALARRRKSGK